VKLFPFRTSRRVRAPLACALLVSLALPASAAAVEAPVPIAAGAGADWGVKASFRNYITGPIAHGSIALADGATRNADGTFHFPVAGGEYDPDTSATVVRFSGSVRFSGHDGALEMTVANPRVEITPEGAALYADMASKPNEPGAEVTQYPGVEVAVLDDAGAFPEVGPTATAWPALPAALTTAAEPAFAGFYSGGTALDPFSFAYDGPGGKPQVETWTAPGTALWSQVATGELGNGVYNVAADPVRNRLWVSDYDRKKLTLLDATTLARQTEVGVDHSARNVAVLPTTGVAFSIDTEIKAIRESGGSLAVDPALVEDFGSSGNNTLVAGPDGSLWSAFDAQLLRWREDGAGGWTRSAFPLPAGYTEVRVTADGAVYVASQIGEVLKVTLDGTEIATTPIPGTTGVTAPLIAPDGTVTFVRTDVTGPPYVITTVVVQVSPDGAGGWTTRELSALDNLANAAYPAISPDGETLYLANKAMTGVLVVRDGAVVGEVAGSGSLSTIATAPDGTPYAVWRNGRVARLAQTAVSPTVDAQPADAAVTLAGSGETGTATFAAAASGDPAPAVRWQRRAPGSARFHDLPGATAATLTVPVTTADNGARYRAVFENAAGAIATAPAALSVTVTPVVPGPGTGGPGPAPGPPGDGGGGGPLPGGGPAPDDGGGAKPAAGKPAIAVAGGVRTLARNRTAPVATLACRKGGAACTVTAPARVRVKIGGRTYSAALLAPKRIAAGKRATVRLRLSKAAARRLAGRRASARVRLTVAARGGAKTTRTVAVTLTAKRTTTR
jgi:hypothetical protein